MSLSLSVLAAILFLAPGIAGFLGSMMGARSQILRASFPPANSLVALIAVVLLSVAAHGIAAAVLAAQDAWCGGHACLPIRFDPNAYGLFVRASADPAVHIAAGQLQAALVAVALLCVATGAATMALVSWDMRRGRFSFIAPAFYGWLAIYDARQIGGSNIVIAYVVTKMRGEALAIGYRGMVEEISLTGDKEIAAITLVAADRFGLPLAVTAGAERNRTVILAELLPRVYIPGREVENIVLNVVQLGSPDEGGEDPACI